VPSQIEVGDRIAASDAFGKVSGVIHIAEITPLLPTIRDSRWSLVWGAEFRRVGLDAAVSRRELGASSA
jgi:hypothetical protein